MEVHGKIVDAMPPCHPTHPPSQFVDRTRLMRLAGGGFRKVPARTGRSSGRSWSCSTRWTASTSLAVSRLSWSVWGRLAAWGGRVAASIAGVFIFILCLALADRRCPMRHRDRRRTAPMCWTRRCCGRGGWTGRSRFRCPTRARGWTLSRSTRPTLTRARRLTLRASSRHAFPCDFQGDWARLSAAGGCCCSCCCWSMGIVAMIASVNGRS